MRKNNGAMPADARGKRIRGRLANGDLFGLEPLSATTPAGWAADGQQGCRWSRTGQPHDIDEFEVI